MLFKAGDGVGYGGEVDAMGQAAVVRLDEGNDKI